MVEAERVTVDDSGAVLISGGAGVQRGHFVLVTNRHAIDSADLGASGVTAGAGYELKAGESERFTLGPFDELWALGPAAGVELHVLRSGV